MPSVKFVLARVPRVQGAVFIERPIPVLLRPVPEPAPSLRVREPECSPEVPLIVDLEVGKTRVGRGAVGEFIKDMARPGGVQLVGEREASRDGCGWRRGEGAVWGALWAHRRRGGRGHEKRCRQVHGLHGGDLGLPEVKVHAVLVWGRERHVVALLCRASGRRGRFWIDIGLVVCRSLAKPEDVLDRVGPGEAAHGDWHAGRELGVCLDRLHGKECTVLEAGDSESSSGVFAPW